jgi:hypothetical protein
MTQLQYHINQWFQTFPLDHLKTAEGLGRPLNNFSASCLTTSTHCAKHTKDENKEASSALNLFHRHLGTSALLVYVQARP